MKPSKGWTTRMLLRRSTLTKPLPLHHSSPAFLPFSLGLFLSTKSAGKAFALIRPMAWQFASVAFAWKACIRGSNRHVMNLSIVFDTWLLTTWFGTALERIVFGAFEVFAGTAFCKSFLKLFSFVASSFAFAAG